MPKGIQTTPRNDDRFGEDACVSFAIYCDENGLTVAEGEALAERLADSLVITAENRKDFTT